MSMDQMEQKTGTRDVTYNLLSVTYHALQGAETYLMYQRDAQEAGDKELEQFFQQAVDDERKRADRAKGLLRSRLG
jgi:rubrerythrin